MLPCAAPLPAVSVRKPEGAGPARSLGDASLLGSCAHVLGG